jgi:AraC family transcriptional regulator, regulatory protein of adaptative response / DNA-3-methyladenine glycosylase II
MSLDWQVCSRARLARDARFDGKFFIGVLSTRIYCRPICRSRTSKESNVRYFPTAAAAAEAGFRPCLRCRPECSPGTPAWAGTRNTVSRALQLISESGLEDGGVERLAERLGVGSRHLRRLFLRHLGATPSAVAHTRRLHFAKKLIDETRLPMGQVALAAGFGCVRRFNAGIRKVYRRTPTQIRRLARRTVTPPENHYIFHLNFRPPYNWPHILDFLAAHATPGVEAVETGCYRRSISLNGKDGYFQVSLEDEHNSLAVDLQFADPSSLAFIIERIRAMFDLNADWTVISKVLRTDPALARRVDALAGLRVPGCWSGFELTTRAILDQQMSVQRATELAGRMVRTFGRPLSAANNLTQLFPEPKALADADLTSICVPTERAKTIRALARAVSDGQIRLEGIADCGTFLKRLCEVPGLAKWTAQYVAMRVLRDPDAFPASALALRRMVANCTTRELERRSEAWRPWRAYAAMSLWRSQAQPAAAVPKGEAPRPDTHLPAVTDL